MRLGDRIYKLRTEKEMSQADLAESLEVSRQSISKWETNSSVPELDKLVKLSEIFGISLDELITGKAAAPPVEDPAPAASAGAPKIIYVEKSVGVSISAAQVIGIILLFCSLLTFVLFACFGKQYEMLAVFFLCLPVALWGVLCLVTKNPFLWCSWCGSVTWWVYTFILNAKWEKATLFLIVGILLVVTSLAYTVHLHKKEQIHIPAGGWALLALALTSAALLLAVNLIPPSTGTVIRPQEIGSITDGSLTAD